MCSIYVNQVTQNEKKNSMSIFNNKNEICKFLMHYSVFLRGDKKHDCVNHIRYIHICIYMCVHILEGIKRKLLTLSHYQMDYLIYIN